MSCFHPLRARRVGGSVRILGEHDGKVFESDKGQNDFTVPCGQCIGCRLERSRQWAVRCMCEAQLYDHNVFVTLTYEGDVNPSLNYSDFQAFMRRVRYAKPGVRFYMCGEYGGNYGRPHFHALLFNCWFSPRVVIRQLDSGFTLYRSPELEALWPHGFSSIGDVSLQSAGYVARYAAKSAHAGHDGKRRSVKLGFVDAETGEFDPFVPEFNRMSLKPGIGAEWFAKYRAEVFGDGRLDRIVIDGMEQKPPRYFKKELARVDAFADEYVDFLRSTKLTVDMVKDDTPDRRRSKELVAISKLSLSKRSEL